MKKILYLLAMLTAGITSASAQGFGESKLFNDGWSFNLGDIKYGGKEYMDISSWKKVELPHDWSVEGVASPALASCTGYLPGGIGWYRKNFTVENDYKGKQVYAYFEGVYNNSEVFINGKWVGKRPNGYISFMYDLTPFIKFGQDNSIAVRVDHSNSADSRWYTGSGIYRDVHIVYADPVHIALWGVFFTADIKGSKADVTVNTTITNTSLSESSVNISNELLDSSGKVVAKSGGSLKTGSESESVSVQKMTVANPELWGLESPYLYTLKTTVSRNGKKIDETYTKVGIRTLTFDADKGFFLNGVSTKLKGVCIHHDAGLLGAAVPKEVWRERLLKLKEIGCNAIRTSHNPQATAVYELCDELGLLVNDEAFDEWEYPKKKWLEGWNVGTPGFQGSADYFREWGKRDLADMIRRDRNHPSIIMWSIGNEVDYPNDPYSHPVLNQEGIGQQHTKGYLESQPRAERLGEIARELVKVVKQYDTSRPVTAALAGAVMSNETDYPKVLDIVGYNYTENRYDMDHAKYPARVLYGSENSNTFEAWKVVRDKEFISGQFIWTGLDYLGESRAWPSRGFNSGLVDFASNIKPSGYFRKALWSTVPTAYVGTYVARGRGNLNAGAPKIWNYDQGETVRVVCYTNCSEAELMLNGKKVGDRKPYDDNSAIIYWDVPFSPGTLEVVAYKDGKEVARDKVATVGQPASLRLSVDGGTPEKGGKVAMVRIEVVDKDGNIVNQADTEITVRVEGPASLIGLESGSNNPADNFRDNVQRCIGGKLLAYVKSGSEAGEIKITARAAMLPAATMNIAIK